MDESDTPVLNNEGLWVDTSNQSFYAYGGDVSGTVTDTTPPANALWQFTPGGNSGSWSVVPISQQSANFSSLVRTVGGAYTSGNGLGFALGGIENDPNSGDIHASVPGLVVYNSSAQVWHNVTAFDNGVGTYSHGAALFVPSFGPQGLLAVVAGAQPNGVGLGDLLSTSSVSLYEPLSGLWKTIAVTGTPPHPCYQPCLVGAQGDNGTYEIFMYGGHAAPDWNSTLALATVSVLSLPAFHWQQTTSFKPDHARYAHSCNAINRQMIVTGGNAITLQAINENNGTWPWNVDSYDSDAGLYQTPEIVKQYYASNPRYGSPILDDAVLRSWFIKVANAHFDDADSNSTNTTSGTPPPITQPASDKSNAGTIAGAVVGGLAGLGLTLVAILYLIRQQRRKHSALPTQDSNSHYRKPELDSTYRTAELESKQAAIEAAGRPLLEMDG
ncbi:hypothetical protein MMC17_008840 [Xylographa soralifera]|nr:hypothetical protein [Xylographa soralifera]